MYDFYPEWGPTRHRDQDQPQPIQRRPRYWQAARSPQPAMASAMTPAMAMAGAPEDRDAEADRPDDN